MRGLEIAALLAFVAAAGCPRASTSDGPSTHSTATTTGPTSAAPSVPSLVIPSSSSVAPSTSASTASFDGLARTLAALAADPEHRSPTNVQRRGDELHYAFAIPGVKQSMLAVVDHRPDAWSFDLYAQGVPLEAFGALRAMPPPKEGGLHWIVLDGPLAGCQLFRAPDDPSLFVVQSPTWLDAHE